MCVAETLLDNLGDVKISQLGLHVLEEEQIRTFHVSVQDTSHVEGPQSADNLYKHIPDFLLFDVGLSLLIVAYFLEDVAIVSVLHYEAQTGGGLVDKSVSVGNNIRVVN